MADLEQEFQKAVEDARNLKSRPSDQDLLELYGLFKQATVGDNTTPKPGMFQMKEKAKYEVWLSKKGMSSEEAKKAYVKKAKQLIDTYGLQ